MKDWPDPDPGFGTTLEDVERRFDEVLREITELKLEIEQQRWFRWLTMAALVAVLWKLY